MENGQTFLGLQDSVPSVFGGETLDSQRAREFVRVHHVHVAHGAPKTFLLLLGFPLELKKRDEVIENPNVSVVRSLVQADGIPNLLQLKSARVWMLTRLPRMRDRKNQGRFPSLRPIPHFLVRD